MLQSWQDRTADSAPSGAGRARTLAILQDAGRPLGVQEVATVLQAHPNTARIHLHALIDAGLASHEPEPRETPGRPRAMYTATPAAAQTGPRDYQMLAQILTSVLAASLPEPGEAALQAGRAWGRYLSHRPIPYQQVDAEHTVEQLHTLLAQGGFEPERDDQAPAVDPLAVRPIRFRNCPFREVAQDHQGLICAIHLGIMQGALDAMGSPLTADRLEPFVQPALCVAHLAPRVSGQ